MAREKSFTEDMVTGYLLRQNHLQKQLIEAQQEIIRLQKQIQKLTPTNPDDDVNWNKVSGGYTSSEALESNDIELIKALNKWIFAFGEKYIKPYVHHRAYAEMVAHMSRGIAKRLAELEVDKEFDMASSQDVNSAKSAGRKSSKGNNVAKGEPIPLFPDDDL